jgi:Uncharacterized protein conserved in bacteria (DUF2141)
MNGKLDTNWLGLPREGYGFSNDVKGLLSAPSFSAASFQYDGQNLELTIAYITERRLYESCNAIGKFFRLPSQERKRCRPRLRATHLAGQRRMGRAGGAESSRLAASRCSTG